MSIYITDILKIDLLFQFIIALLITTDLAIRWLSFSWLLFQTRYRYRFMNKNNKSASLRYDCEGNYSASVHKQQYQQLVTFMLTGCTFSHQMKFDAVMLEETLRILFYWKLLSSVLHDESTQFLRALVIKHFTSGARWLAFFPHIYSFAECTLADCAIYHGHSYLVDIVNA